MRLSSISAILVMRMQKNACEVPYNFEATPGVNGAVTNLLSGRLYHGQHGIVKIHTLGQIMPLYFCTIYIVRALLKLSYKSFPSWLVPGAIK